MGYCNIVEILVRKREALGLSRRKAVEICNNMISEKTLYRIENEYIEVSKYSKKILDEAYNNRKERFLQFTNVNGGDAYSEGMEYLAECRYSEALSSFKYSLSHATREEDKEYLTELIDFVVSIKEGKVISNEKIDNFEKIVLSEFPNGLTDDKWPLMDFQTDRLILLLNFYKRTAMYDKQERLSRAIIKSISLEYYEKEEYLNLLCVAERALVDSLQDAGFHIEAIEEALSILPVVSQSGNISNTYHLIYSLIWSVQQMSYFDDERIKRACEADLENISLLSEICGNDRDFHFYSQKRKLINSIS